MSKRVLFACIGLVWAACQAREPALRPLSAAEQGLANTYLRLTVVEALRRQEPESADALLDSLATAYDSVSVAQALDALESDPLRWEAVYDVIARRLTDIEAEPDTWWSVARRPSLLEPLPARPAKNRRAANDSTPRPQVID